MQAQPMPSCGVCHYTSIFQAETHAIMQCALALKRLDSSDEHICICSDSQAVLMALCNPRVVSKQIWECIGALNELVSHRPVSLTWVPAHSGIPGNEQADHLAKTASCQPYIGPEPALLMPYNGVKTAIRQWAHVQANNRWQNIKTCREAKLIIQGHSSSKTRELLRLPRQKLETCHRYINVSFTAEPTSQCNGYN